MKKIFTVIGVICLVVVIVGGGVLGGWFETWFGNKVDYVDQKIDDATNYETLKKVEDSCRSMIASYEADKLTWAQYKDSEDPEQKSWADQAKMRANRTATSYNNYILKNSYVWQGNVPSDIDSELPLIIGG